MTSVDHEFLLHDGDIDVHHHEAGHEGHGNLGAASRQLIRQLPSSVQKKMNSKEKPQVQMYIATST